jgi:CRP/FNR family transcriptional regulator, cyclic AMP receptor protein
VEPTRLDEIPLFADLTTEERAEIAARLREVTVEAGTALATQGENAYQLFVIESGQADVTKDGEFVRTLSPGDVFGEIGLLATGTRTASVVATSPMRLLAMFLGEFKQIERRLPGLTKSLRETMAENAARTGF